MSERPDHQLPLGAAIKAEREHRNLSAETVAARAGVKEQWLLRVEAGRGNPTWGHLRRLADAMEAPLPELMKRVEDNEEGEDSPAASTSREGHKRPQEALAKALSHSVRAKALTLLTERIASPKEIADELDHKLTNVSYHVRVLEALGLIELVEEESIRGSVAHFYKAVEEGVFADPSWASLHPKVRSASSSQVVEALLADVAASLADGVFDQREERLLNRTPLLLDEEGWRRVIEIQGSAVKAILEEQASAGQRLGGSRSEGIRAILGLLLFEAAPEK
jgi:transcriptional regulator with XRE-family HTH domain